MCQTEGTPLGDASNKGLGPKMQNHQLSWWIFIVFLYYIVLFLLIPFINILLNNIDKETYKKLLIVILLVFSLWDSIMSNKIIADSGYGIVNFIVLYIIGGYLKLHYNNSKNFSY